MQPADATGGLAVTSCPAGTGGRETGRCPAAVG